MNRKGQALVEFVLILPVFILMLFAVVDFGFIVSKKNELENISVDVISMIRSGKSIDEINKFYPNLSINKVDRDDNIDIKLSENVDIMTPGLNLILGDPYKVEIERIIPSETERIIPSEIE